MLLGNGDGTFQKQTSYLSGSFPMSITAGDLNNDKILDLAVANGGDNTVTMFIGNGNGTFHKPNNSSDWCCSGGDNIG